MALQAIIFDFGGVISSSPFEAFNRYEAARGLPRDFIRQVNAAQPDHGAWAQFERAEIDAVRFDALFLAESRARGRAVAGAELIPLLSGDVRPAMVTALKACRASYRIGCITNNAPVGEGAGMAASPGKAAEVAQVLKLFHHVIESAKIGIRKPDPRIYALMCEALGVEPGACLFLDDLGVNLKPARAMGMQTIKVESEAQALAALAAATGLDFPVPEGHH